MYKDQRETEKKEKPQTPEEELKAVKQELADVKAALNDLILNSMGGL